MVFTRSSAAATKNADVPNLESDGSPESDYAPESDDSPEIDGSRKSDDAPEDAEDGKPFAVTKSDDEYDDNESGENENLLEVHPCDPSDDVEPDDRFDPETSLVYDSLFEDIFVTDYKDFANMDQLDLAISEYEFSSGHRLLIKNSKRDVRRLYRCASHVKCRFFASFGPSTNGCIILKNHDMLHTAIASAPVSKSGRALKKRMKITLQPAIEHLLQVKSDNAKPADVMKTASHMLRMDVTYHQARRALMMNNIDATADAVTSYNLIRPYLHNFAEMNEDSHVDNQIENGRIVRLFVCPGQMKIAILCVRPIISLDACHLKGQNKGTLYIATVKSAMDNIFPIAFGITSENEGTSGWIYFLNNLKIALPDVADNHDTFLFMSDRDKGLENALIECFPRNHSLYCAVHIMRNVLAKFGQVKHEFIDKIAKTHCNIEEGKYLLIIGNKCAAAKQYLEAIDPTKWRSCEWVTNDCTIRFPSRYGITSSNISEAANSMFEDARRGTWFHTIVEMIRTISNRIVSLRRDYAGSVGIVPWCTKVLNENYISSKKYTVNELDDEMVGTCVVFLTNPYTSTNGRTTDNHQIRTSTKCCTCGLWQEHDFPCVHAMAYYRHCRRSLDYIKSTYVSKYYTYEMQLKLTSINILPVVISRLRMDNVTLPPIPPRRHAGRPKVVRLRKRTRFSNPEKDSPIICKKCGKRGHNQKTCERRGNNGAAGNGLADPSYFL